MPINIESLIFDEYDYSINIEEGGINIVIDPPDPPLIPNYGDVSLNGTISPYDATLILQNIVGLNELNEQQELNADVSGEIKAKITVSQLLSLKSTSKLNGDIITNKLSIEPGASFSGSCSMGAVIKDIKHAEKHTEKQDKKEKSA